MSGEAIPFDELLFRNVALGGANLPHSWIFDRRWIREGFRKSIAKPPIQLNVHSTKFALQLLIYLPFHLNMVANNHVLGIVLKMIYFKKYIIAVIDVDKLLCN